MFVSDAVCQVACCTATAASSCELAKIHKSVKTIVRWQIQALLAVAVDNEQYLEVELIG
jgi:hypothetical protein